MARKKQEVQLQIELESQEAWDDMLAKEGLIVIDVCQEWCGPCTSIIPNLRRLKNELGGDELLRFALAKADLIECLEKYRGRCEPCFHLYAGGQLVNVIRGANSPMLIRCIVDELAKEKKVLSGEAERHYFVDPVLAAQELERRAKMVDKEMDNPETPLKEVSIAIIKPNVFAKGKVNDVVQSIGEKFEILAKQEFTFSDEWVKDFYSHIETEPIFEELIEFMTSGPCMLLVLTNASGENVCAEFREFIGNRDPAVAKQENPESLRALFGDDTVKNGIHGSEPGEPATKETSLVLVLMPEVFIPKRPPKPRLMQFVILVPPSMASATNLIRGALDLHEFRIIRNEEIPMTDDIFEKLFDQLRSDDISEFSRMHKIFLNSGSVNVFVVEKMEGIPLWLEVFGPQDPTSAHESPEIYSNTLVMQLYPPDSAVTKSDIYFATMPSKGRQDATAMLRHLDVVKPIAKPEYTIAALKPDALLHRDEIIQRIIESGFQIVDRLERKLTPELVMRMYFNHQNQSYFSKVLEHLTSGPTMFLILYREDAISGWRFLMGPRDPEQAKADAPDSIRAAYGQDIIRNVVFGSDGADEAAHLLHLVWGQNSDVTPEGILVRATPLPSRPPSATFRQITEPNAATQPTEPKAIQPQIPTLIADENFDASRDCEAIERIVQGAGNDDDKLISILTRRSWQQRVAIAGQYKKMFHMDVNKVFETESEPHFVDYLESLIKSPIELVASALHKEIRTREGVQGSGMEEDYVTEVVCGWSFEHLQAIKAEYELKYHKSLQATVEEDLTTPFRHVLARLIGRQKMPENVDMEAAKSDAKSLHQEVTIGGQAGADFLGNLLVERGNAQLAAIFSAYKEIAQKEIEDDIGSSFPNDLQDPYLSSVGAVRDVYEFFAKRLRFSTDRIGSMDYILNRIVVARAEIDLENIKTAYQRLYVTSLLEDIADGVSDDYKHGLEALINGNNLEKKAFEYAVWNSPPPLIEVHHAPQAPTGPPSEANQKPSRTNSKVSVTSGTKSSPRTEPPRTEPPKPPSVKNSPAASIKNSPAPSVKQSPAPSVKHSPAVSVKHSPAVSVKNSPGVSGKASPIPSVKEPMNPQPTAASTTGSRRPSVASVKSTKSTAPAPAAPAPVPPPPADEEEAKTVDG